jgi:hypothetical protein
MDLCAIPSCKEQVSTKTDKYCIKHIQISPNERVRDFDITEKASMDELIRDMRAITRYTWYWRPDPEAVEVAELSLRIALEWKVVSYDAIARLAALMQYMYCTMAALEPVDVYLQPFCLPEPPDYQPLAETRASLIYLMEHCQIHAARFAGVARSLPVTAFVKRRSFQQAADVWWKSRLKIEAFEKALGWLWFSLKRFITSASHGRREGLKANDRTVLRMDAEVLGGLAETLFKTALLHYQELITV